MSKYVYAVASFVLAYVLIVLSFSIHINNKEPENEKNNKLNMVDYEEEKIWRNNSRAQMGNVLLYDGDRILLYGGKFVLYNMTDKKVEQLCKKEGCLHNTANCVNNVWKSNPIVRNGIIYAIDKDRYNIIRIENSEAYVEYTADSIIQDIWWDGDNIFFSTEYALFCFDRENPKQTKKVLARPVLFSYLIFLENKIIFEDESYFLYIADYDGKNEKLITNEMVNMPEISESRIYYRKSKDSCVYSNNFDGTDEQMVIDTAVYRYQVQKDGIYYTVNDGGKSDIYYQKNGEEAKLLFDSKVTVDYMNEGKYVISGSMGDYYLYNSKTGDIERIILE